MKAGGPTPARQKEQIASSRRYFPKEFHPYRWGAIARHPSLEGAFLPQAEEGLSCHILRASRSNRSLYQFSKLSPQATAHPSLHRIASCFCRDWLHSSPASLNEISHGPLLAYPRGLAKGEARFRQSWIGAFDYQFGRSLDGSRHDCGVSVFA